MNLLLTLFTSEYYNLNNNFCVPINGKNVKLVEAKCNDLFGFQPTYKELIDPSQSGVCLFDRLAVDFCRKKNGCTGSAVDLHFGLCQLRNDIKHSNIMLHVNDSLTVFLLENMAQSVLLNLTDMTQVDYAKDNWNSLSYRFSTIICKNGATEDHKTYVEAVAFCMDQNSGYNSDFKRSHFPSNQSSEGLIHLWSTEKWINANQIMTESKVHRNVTNQKMLFPFEICENDKYWYTNVVDGAVKELHYVCCFNWHLRMGILSITLVIVVTIAALAISFFNKSRIACNHATGS